MSSTTQRSWTTRLRGRAVAALPPEKLLPDSQPSYVTSWIYVFGVLSLSALVVLIASGVVLALKGPTWWHMSSIGHFVNSLHLWSVELFYFFMVVHLWGKYLDGGLARRTPAGVDHGRGHLPGGGAVRADRLCLRAAELQRAVDLHAGQGAR